MEQLFSNFSIILLLIIFILSLFLLTKSADWLVEEAVQIAGSFGVSEIIIGATIVSLGTTLPEVATSIISIIQKSSELALGNAVGSIITNMTFILGIGALSGSLPVFRNVARSFSFFALISLLFMGMSFIKNGSHSFQLGGNLSMSFGWVLLVALPIYIFFSFRKTKVEKSKKNTKKVKKKDVMFSFMKIIGSAILVAFAATVLVSSVKVGATRIGVPETIIASTVVAFGTSLPELTTIITATRKGYGSLAVGNIIGANILNLLLVLGLSIAISPTGIMVPAVYYSLGFPVLLLVLLLFGFFVFNTKIREISKKEGILLLLVYVVYLFLNTVR
ncbi:MAG: calcium/sodium antiporter [Lactobacillales bacterium]|jgi:cation:H+ antiporter|nr:calcium/sodium antiporter [Lactobacillales bacterium]